MDFKEIKKEAWEISNKNKWNIWKPILIIGLISGIASGVITSIFGNESATGSILNSVISFLLVPATVGMLYYMLNLVRGKDYSLNNLKEFYDKIGILIGISIIVSIFVTLGCLLFIIPGIIIALNYTFVFYLFAEDKNLTLKEYLDKSKELIKGYRMDYFLFILSFIGWILLCFFIIPIIWVIPYIQTAEILYYEKLKEKK